MRTAGIILILLGTVSFTAAMLPYLLGMSQADPGNAMTVGGIIAVFVGAVLLENAKPKPRGTPEQPPGAPQ